MKCLSRMSGNAHVRFLDGKGRVIAPTLVDYAPLVKRLGGQVVKISPTSTQYVNPMDINLNYSDDDNPLALKVDFLLSFCDIVVGSKDGPPAGGENGH